MTFAQGFQSYVCPGDTISCEAGPFTVLAQIVPDASPDAPDQRQDGFWPSLYAGAPGFIGPGPNHRQRFAEAQAKAEDVMEGWRKGDWFYCGIVLSVYGVRAFLVAQSLNQIEKAYGPNNAILDNCHVRVAFATNDERTAKRISEALGTKTELRSQKNYTGHRLSPWLPHMMVSRQETQRALLTPGEIMQLPATDEIVMVAGAPPIRARKLRYFEDRNFTARVLPAASIVRPSVAGSHDWLGRVLCPPLPTFRTRNEDPEGDGGLGLKPELGEPPVRLPDDLAAEIAPDSEEDIATEQDGQLRNVRRAVAMDQGNKDFLPDF